MCLNSEWLGKPIPLEIHHVDGDSNNDIDENLQLLCCNCHAFTDNYRGRGISKTKNISDENIVQAVNSSSNIRQLLLILGLTAKGGNYTTIRNRISRMGLIDKFKKTSIEKICPNCGIDFMGRNKFCSDECNKNYLSCKEKKKEKNFKICIKCTKEFKGRSKFCSMCKQLEFSKNNKRFCPNCNIEFESKNKFCSSNCANKYNSNGSLSPRKANRPEKEILEKMISTMGYSATGRAFGVSDNAIRKWLKRANSSLI